MGCWKRSWIQVCTINQQVIHMLADQISAILNHISLLIPILYHIYALVNLLITKLSNSHSNTTLYKPNHLWTMQISESWVWWQINNNLAKFAEKTILFITLIRSLIWTGIYIDVQKEASSYLRPLYLLFCLLFFLLKTWYTHDWSHIHTLTQYSTYTPPSWIPMGDL